MKKKHQKHRPRAHARSLQRLRPRNSAAGFAPAAPRPRARNVPRSSASPDWKSIAAAVAGGAGSAAIGGLISNQQILSSEAVGLGFMLGGGATAYFGDGMTRIVGTSVAASGAGQFALALMNKSALKAIENKVRQPQTVAAGSSAPPAPTTPLQLAPPPPPAAQAPVGRSASGGGVVVDLFRAASHEIDDAQLLDDEWRYGIRDDACSAGAAEPMVIDLDEAA